MFLCPSVILSVNIVPSSEAGNPLRGESNRGGHRFRMTAEKRQSSGTRDPSLRSWEMASWKDYPTPSIPVGIERAHLGAGISIILKNQPYAVFCLREKKLADRLARMSNGRRG